MNTGWGGDRPAWASGAAAQAIGIPVRIRICGRKGGFIAIGPPGLPSVLRLPWPKPKADECLRVGRRKPRRFHAKRLISILVSRLHGQEKYRKIITAFSHPA
ncbi:hypothetical protein J2847_006250 [Azospirillum agricola]|uniref:hypothetical protein n=1 Tax=Azospirillum agricola TaxID=1720247 RepID=UPI001AE93B2A|nr:hypothetical protein [Azospirillum agricola]MBP2232915.1 hypothetical protein [Azospirillum agricola]